MISRLLGLPRQDCQRKRAGCPRRSQLGPQARELAFLPGQRRRVRLGQLGLQGLVLAVELRRQLKAHALAWRGQAEQVHLLPAELVADHDGALDLRRVLEWLVVGAQDEPAGDGSFVPLGSVYDRSRYSVSLAVSA
jgi:hypothetical protein